MVFNETPLTTLQCGRHRQDAMGTREARAPGETQLRPEHRPPQARRIGGKQRRVQAGMLCHPRTKVGM